MSAWSRHQHGAWQERAGDPRLPHWLRVTALAYGSHRANGHAMFARGQVALVLADVNTDTGEVTPRDRRLIHRDIAKAVEYGWLAEGSTARCLIVPAHAIHGGLGSPTAECPQHPRSKDPRKPEGRHLKAVGG